MAEVPFCMKSSETAWRSILSRLQGAFGWDPKRRPPPPDHAAQEIALPKGAGNAAENLVTGGQIAGPASHNKATIQTADRDFLRFITVRCKFLLDG